MKIGIIGYGFVGKALKNAFTEEVKTLEIDPKLNTTIQDLYKFNPDSIFICLPTPMHDDGNQDISIVEKVLKKLLDFDSSCLIVIKSTIHPGNLFKLRQTNDKFVYNPEFLREKYAKYDFINSDLIIFGGEEKYSKILAGIYSKYTKCVNNDYIFTDVTTASLVKYSINSFLATKTIFFNELQSLFLKTGTLENWENFINFISKDKRIGDSHMMVPGHDGRYGFGGACLPKDTIAITKYAEKLGVNLGLIKNALNTNNNIRAKYNNETKREVEQNINFREED